MVTSDSKDTRLYGRNGGQVVSVLAFNSGDRSLNPAEVYSLVQYFLFLLNINTIFTTTKCETDSSSTRHWDSNSRPLGHVSHNHNTMLRGHKNSFHIVTD